MKGGDSGDSLKLRWLSNVGTQSIDDLGVSEKGGSMFQKNRSVFWWGDVDVEENGKIVEKIISLWEESKEDPIYLYITSGGGHPQVAFGFYDFIHYVLRPTLTTINLGDASSSALVIFLAGGKRLISPHAHILLHQMESNLEGHAIIADSSIESLSNHNRFLRQTYADIVVRHSTMSKNDVLAMSLQGTVISANEAVELGLAHETL